ncbi:MAG: class I SAM-dependent methyltransferase [bacterium]
MQHSSAEQTSAFFQQWAVYQAIIEYNYMYHREIIEQLNEIIQYHPNTSDLQVLDLGCGDAALFAQTHCGEQIVDYTGVDLSVNALDFAQEKLQSQPFAVHLIKDDFLQAIQKDEKLYDLIVVGYTLHHLSPANKQDFFLAARQHLKPQGQLLIYDVVRTLPESRDTFVARMCEHFTHTWTVFNEAQMRRIHQHIRDNDQPEAAEFFAKMQQQAGFKDCRLLFQDQDNFYQMMVYQA